jgi:YspA, cpYpsA-related SLOG family
MVNCMKLGVVGSRAYSNFGRIKKVIEKYKEQFEDLTIVSGGCPDGADSLAKIVAEELGLKYVEFPPKHRPHNSNCVLPKDEYDKPYHVSNYFERNGKIAEYCDHLVAFVVKDVRCNGTRDTTSKAEKLGKVVTVFEDRQL